MIHLPAQRVERSVVDWDATLINETVTQLGWEFQARAG